MEKDKKERENEQYSTIRFARFSFAWDQSCHFAEFSAKSSELEYQSSGGNSENRKSN